MFVCSTYLMLSVQFDSLAMKMPFNKTENGVVKKFALTVQELYRHKEGTVGI
jgi:hypothetical protein